ncbi:CgeB family protein [Rhizosaccharibacter radicis]|uniref:Glycosyltransferase n=1 Tax=Rhizosaccharibacter radicis TaxID=2782605 RepID=A0ABT1VZD9_9PROT|nr:glycosyltransferase [Acetobacteraceae bacterium KSS12]
MQITVFSHSLSSCWNHGNAHFLRGVLSELVHRGHRVRAWEPTGSWSRSNLAEDAGDAGLEVFAAHYPELDAGFFQPEPDGAPPDLDALLDGADLVLVHEWNEPALVAAIGRRRANGGRFRLLFHDTHHRAVSDPEAIRHFDLSGYDGVLAFGETLAAIYRNWGWGDRVWVWHEGADLRRFHPPAAKDAPPREGGVWIGNWGDGERSAELESFLLAPMREAQLPLDIYGVRYPEAARQALRRHDAVLRGWLPNARAPEIFARHLATVHVPRRFYVEMLPGIPTIRVFEALACGIPLVSAPWQDSERLFRPGADFLVARDGTEMTRHLRALKHDPELRAALAAHGLDTVRRRHGCTHRADELLAVAAELGAGA